MVPAVGLELNSQYKLSRTGKAHTRFYAKYRKTELPDRTGPRSECAEGVNLPDMVPTVQIESYFAKMNFHTPNPHTQTFTHVRGWERLVCGVKPCVANHGSKSKNTPFAAGK